MKRIFFAALAATATTIFAACNAGDENAKDHDMAGMEKDAGSPVGAFEDEDIKAISVTWPGVDTKIATSIKEIADHYLHIKNVLINGNADEAANGGRAIGTAMSKIDKSLFTAEQKAAYDEVADDLKQHAEGISETKELDQQRELFSKLSHDVYALTKAFGGGRVLYHDHCPMYNDNKGAMWLSENKEIRNPYYGDKMLTCGTVEEIIK